MSDLVFAIAMICSTGAKLTYSNTLSGLDTQQSRAQCVLTYTKCVNGRDGYGNNTQKLEHCTKEFLEK